VLICVHPPYSGGVCLHFQIMKPTQIIRCGAAPHGPSLLIAKNDRRLDRVRRVAWPLDVRLQPGELHAIGFKQDVQLALLSHRYGFSITHVNFDQCFIQLAPNTWGEISWG